LRKADIASNGIYVGECRRAQRMAAERRMLELPWLNHVRFTPESDIKCDIWNVR
jgi:hypothetical protein